MANEGMAYGKREEKRKFARERRVVEREMSKVSEFRESL